MRFCIITGLFLLAFMTSMFAQGANPFEGNASLLLKTVRNHSMQYYISLPKGWTSAKTWRILVVLEAAEKEYKTNAMRFVEARKDLPFIIVAPFIVSNGNQGRRDPAIFPYSTTTWDIIEKAGNCAFDTEGLEKVLSDVRKEYNGEEKILLTGFEAGTHLLWSWVFTRPESIEAAVPVAGNFIGRCVEEHTISKHPLRVMLPIHALYGANDSSFGKNSKLFSQWERAKQIALTHGYKNISESDIPNTNHVPVPNEVIAYFAEHTAKKQK